MNPIAYLKKNGVRHTIDVFYRFKLQIIFEKAMLVFMKHKPLQDVIMIESHNDFDSNGGAFYQYLIENDYNKRFKIVWMLKHNAPSDLPENVTSVPANKPSFKKAYYRSVAKVMTSDCYIMPKLRKEQKLFYFTHGPIALKNCKGKLPLPENVDHILAPSEFYAPIMADQYNMTFREDLFVFLGYPMHDILYMPPDGELKKITDQSYDKVILWMPTFRKGGGFQRNDSTVEQPLGIPLMDSLEQFEALNAALAALNCFLIIKIHPMQDMEMVKISDRSHIKVINGTTVKQLGVDNYRLMRETDALITDYSSVAFDYLHLDKPIAYVLADEKDYKLGFVVDDPRTMMAGDEINTFEDLLHFAEDSAEGKDSFREERHALFDKLFKYHDGNSCKRIVEFMNI